MNKIILVIWIFLGTTYSSIAQDNLSAMDAVKIALENNYQIEIADLQTEAAKINNTWGEAGLYPTVSLGVGNNNTIQDNSENPFTFTPGIILSQGLQPTLSTNWNIFSGFAVRISKTRLNLLEEQSANNAMSIVESTIQDVLKAYYTAQLQNERKELFRSIMNLSRERFEYYQIKDKYSGTSSLELLQFRNQYLTDSTNYLMQEISHKNSLRNLLLLMNISDSSNLSTSYTLSDRIEMPTALFNYSEVESEMLENNKNLKNQFINIELQKTNTAFQKSFLYPTLSFSGGVNPNWSWIKELNSSSPNPIDVSTYTISYYGNFNLRYTLFNNWKTKRAIEVSKIQEDIAQLSTESMEKTLKTTLRNLLELYELRTQLVQISLENITYAKEAFEMAQRQFDLGSINSISLAGFKNNYQNTLIQHYENQFNQMDAYLEIIRLGGSISLEYLSE